MNTTISRLACILTIAGCCTISNASDTPVANELANTAHELYRTGNLQASLSAFENTLRLSQTPLERADALRMIGQIDRKLGHNAEAEWAYSQAIQIMTSSGPGVLSPIRMAMCSLALGELMSERGDHQGAINTRQGLLDALGTALPPRDTWVANVENARDARALGNIPLADRYFERAKTQAPGYRAAEGVPVFTALERVSMYEHDPEAALAHTWETWDDEAFTDSPFRVEIAMSLIHRAWAARDDDARERAFEALASSVLAAAPADDASESDLSPMLVRTLANGLLTLTREELQRGEFEMASIWFEMLESVVPGTLDESLVHDIHEAFAAAARETHMQD